MVLSFDKYAPSFKPLPGQKKSSVKTRGENPEDDEQEVVCIEKERNKLPQIMRRTVT